MIGGGDDDKGITGGRGMDVSQVSGLSENEGGGGGGGSGFGGGVDGGVEEGEDWYDFNEFICSGQSSWIKVCSRV